jgi:hypothetical protein
MLPVAKLWKRTSGKGQTYLAGRLGGVRVLVMPKRDGEDGDHTHVLIFAEASEQQDGQNRRGGGA